MALGVDLGLGGIFRDILVNVSDIVSAYACSEMVRAVARDIAYDRNHGVWVATDGCDRGVTVDLPEGALGCTFDGVGYIEVPHDGEGYALPGDNAARNLSCFGGDVSIAILLKTTHNNATEKCLVHKQTAGSPTGVGWKVSLVSGAVRFYLRKTSGLIFSIDRGSIADGAWHLVWAQWDSAAGTARVWVDGVQSGATDTTTPTEPEINTGNLRIAKFADGSGGFPGTLSYVGITRNADGTLPATLQATRFWTDVTAHVRHESCEVSSGMASQDIQARQAGIGTFSFVLHNTPIIDLSGSGVGSAAGVATALFVGSSAGGSDAIAAGSATVVATGASAAEAVWSAAGSASVSGVGSSGNAFYVELSGSDANPGTFASPKLTIRAGVALLSAGDTLYIRGTGGGVYTTADDVIDSALYTVPNGTSWAAPVTITGYQSETVTIRPPDGIHAARLTDTDQYIVVQDLIFDYVNDTSDREGIYVSGGSHHIRFLRVEVENCNNFGVVFASGSGGFNEFIDGEVHHCGDLSGTDSTRGHGLYHSSADNLIEGNSIHDNEGYGVHFYNDSGAPRDVDRNVVRNNRIYNNGLSHSTAYGIIFADGDDNVAYNNLVYDNNSGIWLSSGDNNQAYNNTVYSNVNHGIELQSYTSAPIVRNNISYLNGGTNIIDNGGTGTPVLSNNLTSDPSFVNAGAFDFHIQSGSAARDAGTTVAAVTTDFDGVARPQGAAYCIGAYEYV